MGNNMLGLIDTMNNQKEAYLKLLQLAKEKKDVLVEGNILRLNEIVSEEQTLLNFITDYEVEKRKITKEIRYAKNIKTEEDTLDDLLELMDENLKDEVIKLVKEFRSIIDGIRLMNYMNGMLIESQLDFISMSFNLLTNRDQPSSAYNVDGKASTSKNLQFIDKKA